MLMRIGVLLILMASFVIGTGGFDGTIAQIISVDCDVSVSITGGIIFASGASSSGYSIWLISEPIWITQLIDLWVEYFTWNFQTKWKYLYRISTGSISGSAIVFDTISTSFESSWSAFADSIYAVDGDGAGCWTYDSDSWW